MGCATDSSDNIYVTAEIDGLTDTAVILAKWNTSGTAQWQRKFTESSNDIKTNRHTSTYKCYEQLHVESSDDICMTFYMVSDDKVYLAKLPNDGTGTGTYATALVYGASTYTEQAGTLTDAIGGLTEAAAAHTGISNGFTPNTSIYTSQTLEEVS